MTTSPALARVDNVSFLTLATFPGAHSAFPEMAARAAFAPVGLDPQTCEAPSSASRCPAFSTGVPWLGLLFRVTPDEEQVRIVASVGPATFDLGTRSFHYLLLTLARRRLTDAAQGLPDFALGWMQIDELSHDPSMSGARLNTDVFRIRRHFAATGIEAAREIIERRSTEIRIGTGRLRVESW
jgi:hypothetical protein